MRWLRVSLASGALGLVVWAMLAWVVDRAGAAPRIMYRVGAQEVVVVLGARVDADGRSWPSRVYWALREVPAIAKDLVGMRLR